MQARVGPGVTSETGVPVFETRHDGQNGGAALDCRTMKTIRGCFLVAAVLWLAGGFPARANPSDRTFRVGASSTDVTPTNFPVIVNGGFLAVKADRANDPLHMRWLVLDDGATRVALGVLDTCLMPREFVDAVKARATKLTGIPRERIMLSATHTHTAPSLMQALGTPIDPNYPAFVTPRIVEGLQRAVKNLAPARVGWTVAQAPDHTHTRVWIRRPDRMLVDPFGVVSVRANMHPGYQSPDVIGPVGPSDPALTLLAAQTPDGRPIAVLANYSMHYFGSRPVSADYYGAFAEKIGTLIGAKDGFVGIMSQGTSGDQHWMDYGQPKRNTTKDDYASELAQIAATACKTLQFHDWVPLAMAEKTLRLATRQPDAKRLAWARDLVAKMKGRIPKDRSEVYACEQLWLKQHPTREARLQALRVGDLGIAVWPCEVFAITGLKLKAQSPLQPAMNIELANAEEGYIPPPELYTLGGYNTWACRSAGLEMQAEPKITGALLGLLEKVSGQRRHQVVVRNGAYAEAVLAAKPLAYWRLEEWSGPTAFDATGHHHNAAYESGVARWLDGPSSPAFSGTGVINRCPHFAGGRLSATLKELKETYTVEFWFWNGLPNDAHPVTGYLFSRGGESLALGGTASGPGKLAFGSLVGPTMVAPKTWNHVVLVREGSRVAVYLNGHPEPEISGTAAVEQSKSVFIAGDAARMAAFEGKMDEVAVYGHALSPGEIQNHYQRAGVSSGAIAMNQP